MKIKDPNSFEQKAFVILVKKAQLGDTITYSKLSEKIRYSNPRSIGDPLLLNVAKELRSLIKEKIPAIQTIVVNQKTKLPGDGVGKTGILINDVHKSMQEVFAYKGWSKVLYEVNPALVMRTIVEVINTRSQGTDFGNLQEYRKDILELGNQGGRKTVFRHNERQFRNNYVYHYGGSREFQFNIGHYEGNGKVRFGAAFSLQSTQALPDIKVLFPQIAFYNEYMQDNKSKYSDLRLWSHNIKKPRRNLEIEEREYENVNKNFIVIGTEQPIENIDYDYVLDVMNRLMLLYLYILTKGGRSFGRLKKEDTHFQFSPGMPNFNSSNIANLSALQIERDSKHIEIQEKLYKRLRKEFGADNVGSEIATGSGGRIDIIVSSGNKKYIIYEVKTAQTAQDCIGQALGQLLEYSLWPHGSPNTEKIVVVGEPEITDREKEYLEILNKSFPLPLEYISVKV